MNRVNSQLHFRFSQVHCAFLFCKNLITQRRLTVRAIEIEDGIVVFGSKSVLNVDVEGCHRIKFGENFYIPGTRNRISFVGDKTKSIRVTFFGYNESVTSELLLHRAKVAKIVEMQSQLWQNRTLLSRKPNTLRLRGLECLEVGNAISGRLGLSVNDFDKNGFQDLIAKEDT